MSRRAKSVPPVNRPFVVPLRCNDLLFVNEYLANGRNGTAAYRKVHPNAKYASAEVSAHRLLSKAKVQFEIATRLQHAGGITKEGIEADLLLAKSWAIERKQPLELASVSMDCAKLAGFLVEKREVKTITEEESAQVRALVAASLRSPESLLPTPTTPSGSG